MRKDTLIFLLLFLTSTISYCQPDSSYTLSGTVVDANTNTPLAGAHLLTSKNIGSKTSELGAFNIRVFYNDTITVSFIGFKPIKFIAPKRKNGIYITKFKLSKDSIILDEIVVFPYPTYKEFKEAFIALDKQSEKVKIKGINMYIDTRNEPAKSSILNPASYIYDKLFDKQAKLKRRLDRYRNTIKNSKGKVN